MFIIPAVKGYNLSEVVNNYSSRMISSHDLVGSEIYPVFASTVLLVVVDSLPSFPFLPSQRSQVTLPAFLIVLFLLSSGILLNSLFAEISTVLFFGNSSNGI